MNDKEQHRIMAKRLYLDKILGDGSMLHILDGEKKLYTTINNVLDNFDDYFTYRARLDNNVVGSYAKNPSVVVYKKTEDVPNIDYNLTLSSKKLNVPDYYLNQSAYILKVSFYGSDEYAIKNCRSLAELVDTYYYILYRECEVSKIDQEIINIVKDIDSRRNSVPEYQIAIKGYICYLDLERERIY